MIDWWMVAANALWIMGLSIVLAALSYHDWLARESGRRRRALFKERSFRLPGASGMFLTCVGWGLSHADRWWEQVLWFFLAALFGWEMLGVMVVAYKRSKPARARPASDQG